MNNPVMQALVNARVQEVARGWERAEAEVWSSVVQRLGAYADEREEIDPATVLPFVSWCEEHGVRTCPAQPASVAGFVLDHAGLGLAKLSSILGVIALEHQRQGLANPVATYVVGTALMQIGEIAPPRSWPKEHWPRFSELPTDLQEYIRQHDARREKVIRQAQNDAAAARKEKQVETEAAS